MPRSLIEALAMDVPALLAADAVAKVTILLCAGDRQGVV